MKKSRPSKSHGSKHHGQRKNLGAKKRTGRGPHRPIRPAQGKVLPEGRIVVGIHAVKEALKVRPRAISELWLRDKYADSQQLNDLAEIAALSGVPAVTKSAQAMDRIIGSHQGIMAFLTESPQFDFNKTESLKYSTLLVLDGVEDPHNLGAVLRTAWLIGVNAVLIPDVRSANLSPAVSKVAQGACEHIPVVAETSLQTTLEDLKSKGYWIFGMSHTAPQSLYESNIPDKVVWVLGSESHGVRKPLERLCDSTVSIPQTEDSASYNVSVAAALALGETFRQRTAFSL